MDTETLKDLLYLSFMAGMIVLVLFVSARVTIARLRQKNYFLNRDRERYAETLYASKDGYFAFIYPDERIKDPRKNIRQRCSRRLAVMLNLKNGVQSSFEDVLSVFIKEDSKKIQKYLSLMQKEGIVFEDNFKLKNNNHTISIFGGRINGADGNLYCDMLWFRELSAEMAQIRQLTEEKTELERKLSHLENLIDNLNYPVWLRDENLNIITINKKYADFLQVSDKADILAKQAELSTENVSKDLAELAQKTQKTQKKQTSLTTHGQALFVEITETPFHSGDQLDKISTAGMLTDLTELAAVKRNFQIHQAAHLEVISALGTAFAIFDNHQKLIFYNKSFTNLWNLDPAFLEKNPLYAQFLEQIRNARLLPEVSDFKSYKEQEEKMFTGLIESKEELLHIPDGRTFRRVVSAHPNGLIFAYEDISDRLAATRMINELVAVQQNILDNVSEAILIFGQDQRLKFYNKKYLSLWNARETDLKNLPNLAEVLDMQKDFFTTVPSWEALKQNMMNHILNLGSSFYLERDDKQRIEAVPVVMADDSIMLTYIIDPA